MSGNFRTEVVEQISALTPVVAHWENLWAACPSATPFQHPSWILSFYREFQVRNPRILLAWQGSSLVMVAPFYLWHGPAEIVLALAGNGVSDYLDCLVRPAAEPIASGALSTFLKNEDAWTRADFRDLEPSATCMQAALAGVGGDLTTVEVDCPRAELPERAEDLPAQLRPALRRDVSRAPRQLARLGVVTLTKARPDDLEGHYLNLINLHTRQWQADGLPGIFAGKLDRSFFRDAFTGLATAGLLRLLTLWLDGRPVAAAAGFVHGQRYYHFITGYDPQYRRQSLGSYIIFLAWQEAIDAGARFFDFLRGGEAYKYRWGATRHPVYRRILRPLREDGRSGMPQAEK